MCVVFGDEYGFPQLVKHVPNGAIKCVVAASIRPQSFSVAEETARFLGVPFLVQPRIGDVGYEEFLRKINSLGPDYFIVNSYSMKLHRDVLALPKRAAVNIHGALLPRYRGANPIQWALIHDEIMTGVTMHYMTDEFDAGDIISQRQIPIDFLDTWLEILARLAWATEELLHDEIPKLFQGTCGRIPQDPSLARKWPRRKPEDGRIDWSKSVLSIYNLIRALVKPLPGAFFDKGGERIVLDTFRTIGEVTVLKHQLGFLHLEADSITLRPCDAASAPEGSGEIRWDVRLRANDKSVGTCRLSRIHREHGQAFATISIPHTDTGGSGTLLREATDLTLAFAYQELDIEKKGMHVAYEK